MECLSPEQQTATSEVADLSPDENSQHFQSFMPSPPYTPHSQSPTKQSPTNPPQLPPGLHMSPETSGFYASSNASSPCCSTQLEARVHVSPADDYSQSLTPPETSPYCADSVEGIDLTSEATQFAGGAEVSCAGVGVGPNPDAVVGSHNLTELHFMNEGAVDGFQGVPGSYISQARARYTNVASSAHGGYHQASRVAASESISKWSQWLKETSPPSAQAF